MSHSSVDNQSLVEEPIDAIVEVYISEDKLEASINIKPPQNGGKEVDAISLREILLANKVTYGINTEIIDKICENPRYNEKILVARGISPIKGQDGSFQILFDTSKNNILKEKEDGRVDFYNLENIENVKKDQVLCSIVAPKEGKDGISVLGNRIPFIKGKPVPSLQGKNTKISEDKTKIKAKIDGQVDFTLGKINVHETLYIKDNVDHSTGNIKVVGNAIINGRVLSGFVVEATGNIQIYGGLSSVKLIAGGDIHLRGGIIGGDITCGGNLTSKFIENCKAFVEGDIITDYVMNSDIVCRKNLLAIDPIGKIVGGKYLVSENIQAKTIGSNANVKTFLEIKIDPSIIERTQELDKEIKALKNQRGSLISLINLLKQVEEKEGLTLERKEDFKSALFTYSTINESIENKSLEIHEITEWIKSKGYGQVVCGGDINAGTNIKIGSERLTIEDPIFGKTFYYTNEGIRMKNS